MKINIKIHNSRYRDSKPIQAVIMETEKTFNLKQRNIGSNADVPLIVKHRNSLFNLQPLPDTTQLFLYLLHVGLLLGDLLLLLLY